MPRAVDLYPHNLQLTHDPTKQLTVDVPGKKNPDILAQTILQIPKMIEEGLAAVAAGISNLIGNWSADITEAISGVEDGDTHDLGTWALNIRYGVESTVNAIVNTWFGWTGIWDPADAADALANQSAAIAGLSASVTALQNNANNQAMGGRAVMLDLTVRPDGATFGADFAHLRTGSGTGHYGIRNGKGGVWLPVNDHDAADNFTYIDLETATDYQKVWMVFSSAPAWVTGGIKARNEIHGRKNAAGDTYVFGGLDKQGADIGCVVAGARTVFATRSGLSFKSNTPYALELGTIAGLRIFRLSEGSTPIIVHAEIGTTSRLGADYRRAGGSGQALASWLGTSAPGTVVAIAVGDNYPPAVVGSGAEMWRASDSDEDIDSGTHQLPAGFFDAAGIHTDDITADTSTGTFTVSRRGWYRATARISMSSSIVFPQHLSLVLFRGSGSGPASAERVMGPDAGAFNTGIGAYASHGVYGSVDIYLDAGDYIAVGYQSSDSLGALTGDASGAQAWFTIAATGQKVVTA